MVCLRQKRCMLQVRLSCMGGHGRRVSDDGSYTSGGSNNIDMANWIADSLQWPGWLVGHSCSRLTAAIVAVLVADLDVILCWCIWSQPCRAVSVNACAQVCQPGWLHVSIAGVRCERRLITVLRRPRGRRGEAASQ